MSTFFITLSLFWRQKYNVHYWLDVVNSTATDEVNQLWKIWFGQWRAEHNLYFYCKKTATDIRHENASHSWTICPSGLKLQIMVKLAGLYNNPKFQSSQSNHLAVVSAFLNVLFKMFFNEITTNVSPEQALPHVQNQLILYFCKWFIK